MNEFLRRIKSIDETSPSNIPTATYFNSSFTLLNQAYIRHTEREKRTDRETERDKEEGRRK